MKVYQTNEIKNISILGSSGSGKTTLAEAMLYEGGVIKVAAPLRQEIRCPIISRLRKSMDTQFSQPFSVLSGRIGS